MDGTLVDSEHCAAQAISDVLPAASISTDEILESYRGMELKFIFTDISERFGVQLPTDIIDSYRARESELSEALISINPGVVNLLNKLDRHICIASNAPREKTYRSLERCGLSPYFGNRVYSAYDVKAWKPDPTLFLHAASEEGFTPEQCIVVEDSDAGLAAAKSADMRSIFYNPRARDTVHNDIPAITEFQELLGLLA